MEQTFREYTEQRIIDAEKMKEFMPETFTGNYEVLRHAYAYEDNLMEVKKALEIMFDRKITWFEVDQFQNYIGGHINNIYGKEIKNDIDNDIGGIQCDNEEDKINANIKYNVEYSIRLRMKLCELLNCNFDEESYRFAIEEDFKNRIK